MPCFCAGVVRITELSRSLSDAEREFDRTVSYFCVEAPSGKGGVGPTHFFGLWSPFLREFQRLWTIEMKNRAVARYSSECVCVCVGGCEDYVPVVHCQVYMVVNALLYNMRALIIYLQYDSKTCW